MPFRLRELRRWRFEWVMMARKLGYYPNLLRPTTFNEKVARRKLSESPPLWSQPADKVAVRAIVKELIGEQYLIRRLLVADVAEDIVLDDLPDRFMLKASHGSGWVWPVRASGSRPSQDAIRRRCAQWLATRYGVGNHETWYEAIPPRVIVEELLEDRTYGTPLDFKYWVFHGRVEYIQIDADRFTAHTRAFYDREWRLQVIAIAERLAQLVDDFVRVDLYCVNDRTVYFGEYTLSPEAGWGRFWPSKAIDRQLGGLW